jgi:micrococcal nuclease
MTNSNCPRCGRAYAATDSFCRDCGGKVGSTPPAPANADQTALHQVTRVAEPTSAHVHRPRRIGRYAVIGVVAFLGLGAIGNLVSPRQDPELAGAGRTVPATPRSELVSTPTPVPTAAPNALSGPTGATDVGHVTRIVDGDTIHVDIDGTDHAVRYIGMNTPEVDDADADIRVLADAATDANSELVSDRDVTLERDVSEVDRYGRLLRNVWIQRDGRWVLVGLELVAEGFAQVSTYPPDVKYVDLLLQAELAARESAVGLWAAAATPEPSATPTPAPTPIVSGDAIEVFDTQTFKGAKQTYIWPVVSLSFDIAVYKITGTASASGSCKVTWGLADGDQRDGFTLQVSAGATTSRSRTFDPAIRDGTLTVKSTCKSWSIWVAEYIQPTPTPRPATGGGDCHPSYGGACLKQDAGDYDCAGGSGNGPNYVEGPIDVVGPDEFRLDGDNDGIGCE